MDLRFLRFYTLFGFFGFIMVVVALWKVIWIKSKVQLAQNRNSYNYYKDTEIFKGYVQFLQVFFKRFFFLEAS
jgi:hypothetical protein